MRVLDRGLRFAKRYSRKSLQRRSIEDRVASLVPQCLVIDVGASHFPHVPWRVFRQARHAHWILIDPNEESLAYVDRWSFPSLATKVPIAVGAQDGNLTLHLTHVPTGSSIYEPIIPASMKDRLGADAHDYFFPVEVVQLAAKSLPSILEPFDLAQPCVVKLDTQGSELDILRPLQRWLASGRVVGVELEASLLASPLYRGSPHFWQAQEWFESLGFELISLDVIESPVRGTFRNSRSYPHECDAVFALRPDVVSLLPLPSRAMVLAFYVANQLYGEALRMLDNDTELRSLSSSEGSDTGDLRIALKRQL